MIAFRNGRFLPYSELAVAPHDAGFVFGATVTDFCRTYRHRLFRWPDHLARLRRDAAACFIPLPYSDDELTAAAERLVAENAKALPPDDDLAVITFATPGPLGYMAGEAETGPPTVAMHTFPILKERYRRFFTEGVSLVFSGFLPQFDDPPMGVKHRSRVHWWVASRANPPGMVPLLLAEKDIPDTTIGAVLTVKNGVLEYAPQVQSGQGPSDRVLTLKDGTLEVPPRGRVLDSISARVILELADRLGIETREGTEWPLGRKSDGVTELLLTGTAFGIAGVREFVWLSGGGEVYPWPGPVFTRLAAAWSEMVGVDIVKQFTG